MRRDWLFIVVSGWLVGCSSVQAPRDGLPEDELAPLTLSAPANRQAEALMAETLAKRALTAGELRDKHRAARVSKLPYEPSAATGLDIIQASTHALDQNASRRLSENGFVVSEQVSFPSMLYAYASFYAQDLPLYITTDSILDAVYRSYDVILSEIEETSLVADLGELLTDMRAALAESHADAAARRELDLYLAVAQSLLHAVLAQPVAGADAAQIAAIVEQAQSATGQQKLVLFGNEREVDFTQFAARGHYQHAAKLERYFRAMLWLGRTDFRLIETLPEGDAVFRRSQLEAAMLLRSLLDGASLERFQRIDATLTAFVGHSDSMRVTQIDALMSDLGITRIEELGSVPSQRIAQIIVDGGYGAQSVASQLVKNATQDGRALPLDRAFAFFGQRYTADAHVLSNVVGAAGRKHLLPNPLDAAYAAFGNDAALDHLGPELDDYAGALEAARVLVDAHDEGYWDESLYSTWLKALRALSKHDERQPSVTRTAAWDARVLNTQLASWAQLRHSAGLYAKPGYTNSVLCEYPDAYVDPYPELFGALEDLAARGVALADLLDAELAQRLRLYFENLGASAATLRGMAEAELAGQPFTDAQLEFVNRAVHELQVCPGPSKFDGWYASLDYHVMVHGEVSTELDPVVADIHTQPTDAAGSDVGRVLHIGVDLPRQIVVTTDTCSGVRAYVGVVSAYRELVTEDWKRLDDVAWQARSAEGSLPKASWQASYSVD